MTTHCPRCGGLVLRDVDYVPGLGRVWELRCVLCGRDPDAGPSRQAQEQVAYDREVGRRREPRRGGVKL